MYLTINVFYYFNLNLAMYKIIIIKMMLSSYQCYHILIDAKKGLNLGNIIYGHKKCFPATIHSYFMFSY
jgi:hypothetical protein